MSAMTLSLILLVIAGAVLALGSVHRERRLVPVRLPTRAATAFRRRVD